MQVMNILAVVVVAMAVTLGSANKCQKRAFRRIFNEQMREQRTSDCECEPRPTFVPITPSQEYATTYPNVVQVPRCAGLCIGRGRTCMTTSNKTHHFAVEATTYTDHMKMHTICLTVPVVAHEACACACDSSRCPVNQVCRESDCMCQCNGQLKQECDDRKARHENVMWDVRKCTCRCDEVTDCGYGQEFDMSVCRCIRDNDR